MRNPVPRYRLADESMAPEAAYQLVHDELELDGNPLLNLASFVTTWMEPEATQLLTESLPKNFIDQEEYPQTSELERRCVGILANLFHADDTDGNAMGTSTVGSSEAIHLCGLALKWNWRTARKAQGGDTSRPNIVMGSHVQVVWEKFVRYFEIEPRFVPLSPGNYSLDVDRAMSMVDENTIAVVGILGSTYTGHFDDIAALDAALTQLKSERGLDVPIHVDAASGGFIAPFSQPDLLWDFRLPQVRSINVSGHKYGLVYPGVGWAMWRDRSDLPEDLIFHDNYLGNDQMTFDLNFSKGSTSVIGQYYNFIRLGRQGYTDIVQGMLETAGYLAELVEASPRVRTVSGPGALPVVAMSLVEGSGFTEHDFAAELRAHGWIVPAYTMPDDIKDMHLLRVVVREGFSRDMAGRLVEHAMQAVTALEARPPATPTPVNARPKVC
jgi:glutamate decarboxylase